MTHLEFCGGHCLCLLSFPAPYRKDQPTEEVTMGPILRKEKRIMGEDKDPMEKGWTKKLGFNRMTSEIKISFHPVAYADCN